MTTADDAIQLSGELNVMRDIESALADLDPQVQQRVIRWAADRFDVRFEQPISVSSALQPPVGIRRETGEFDTVAEFFDGASPQNHADRALVVGYWIQVVNAKGEFNSAEVNAELKNLGYPIPNITNALSSLQRKHPALVVQMGKSGKTRQARKSFKVTEAGKKAVEQWLDHPPEED